MYELAGLELKLISEVEKKQSFKCGTFGASSIADRRLATGNFGGQLEIWDLENTKEPIFQSQAHASIINAMDGCGGPVSEQHMLGWASVHRWCTVVPGGASNVHRAHAACASSHHVNSAGYLEQLTCAITCTCQQAIHPGMASCVCPAQQ